MNSKEVRDIFDLLARPTLRWMAADDGVRHSGRVKSPPALENVMRRWEGADFYVQLNNPDSAKNFLRPSADDVILFSMFMLDLDPVGETAAHKAVPETQGRVSSMLGMGVSPTVIDSGRGLQLWYGVEPTSVGGENRYHIQSALRTLMGGLRQMGPVHGYAVDTSCSDLARVARMPGTRNQKTGRNALVKHLSQERIPVDRLLPLGEPAPPKPMPLSTSSWQSVSHWLPPSGTEFLLSGVAEPGRHHTAYAVAAALRDAGMGREEAHKLVFSAASKCRPPLPPADAERIIQNVFTNRG